MMNYIHNSKDWPSLMEISGMDIDYHAGSTSYRTFGETNFVKIENVIVVIFEDYGC